MQKLYILQANNCHTDCFLSKSQAKEIRKFIQEATGPGLKIRIRPVELEFDVYQGHNRFEAFVSSKKEA